MTCISPEAVEEAIDRVMEQKIQLIFEDLSSTSGRLDKVLNKQVPAIKRNEPAEIIANDKNEDLILQRD